MKIDQEESEIILIRGINIDIDYNDWLYCKNHYSIKDVEYITELILKLKDETNNPFVTNIEIATKQSLSSIKFKKQSRITVGFLINCQYIGRRKKLNTFLRQLRGILQQKFENTTIQILIGDYIE